MPSPSMRPQRRSLGARGRQRPLPLSLDPRVNIPALWTSLMGSDADWQYKSLPQQGLVGRSIRQPLGKVLGGSSAINGQAFIAPGKAEIDAWAKLGNPGWDWASLVPSYRKAYTLIPPSDEATVKHLGIDWVNDEYRGVSGPIKVSFPGVVENPLCKAWIKSFEGLNMVTSADPFSGVSIGGYSNTATVDPDTKVRSYAGSAHGGPARQRRNVRIITDAQVQRITFTETSLGTVRVTAVEALVDGRTEIFPSAKEVILAAGVYNTPKLLELSGIGNKTLLDRHGIPVRVDLPGVGENLQDHLMTGLSYEAVDGVVTGDPLMRQEPEALALAQKLYVENKAGPFTIGVVQSHAFMPTLDASALLDKFPGSQRPADSEYYDTVRSIIETPEGAPAHGSL